MSAAKLIVKAGTEVVVDLSDIYGGTQTCTFQAWSVKHEELDRGSYIVAIVVNRAGIPCTVSLQSMRFQ